ncbi:MAG: hypothetical protein A3F61_02940 [Candidatus Blackburnbacteria bacterium RIFCSPHIGHO2_12_FULL_41_13b]|uniref:Cohesin domain-containing protein n=1 Tax=Candidatus Blackburnbacteria bacterium RIFCSPHIGHO2_12_FULL_41_13b TaxID=1797517 RepID=A0A1G1V4Z8_9BACT|nr:MAG: hypothetical protein A3F61_02940 [Candidatus Blackburnbacteria bacterium RIFCSPHIGHO2_12_FULL_41_13b]
MFLKWRSLNFTQRFALTSLFIFLLVTPAIVYLALSPTNPFSRAGAPVSGTGGYEIPATLALQPDIINAAPNQAFYVDVMLDTGSNNVTAAEIVLTYDSALLHAEEAGVTVGDFLPVILEEPTIPDIQTWGYPPPPQTISFAVGSKTETPVSGYGKVATIKFVAQSAEGSTSLSLADGSQVAAVYKQVNVASSFYPAKVNIVKEVPVADNLILNLKFEGVASGSATELGRKIPVDVRFESALADSGQPMDSSATAGAVTNGDGTYTARLAAPIGTYHIFVYAPFQLRKKIGTVGFSPGKTVTVPKDEYLRLIAGDIVDNNVIDIFDYNIIVQDFGSRMPAGGSPADLDFDNDVDIFDYNLVVQNFGKVGD